MRIALTASTILLAVVATVVAADKAATDATKPTVTVNRSWQIKLDRLDRQLQEANLGYALPDFTDDIRWVNTDTKTWDDYRGHILVVQSWTTQTGSGRKAAERAADIVADMDRDDVRVLALHTPQNVDRAIEYIERKELNFPIAIDTTGAFCDELGMYRQPSNAVIDRNGVVAAIGLNADGIRSVVNKLIDQKHDEDAKPATRNGPKADPDDAPKKPAGEFPPHNSGRLSAENRQGKQAPDFYVQQWITDQPDINGKVVVIDFWATWCPPCRAAIPHMNDLHNEFSDSAVFIGLSDEKQKAFDDGMRKYKLQPSNFRYSLALDSSARMKNVFKVRGIPHVAVMSSDWTVRWQGHPSRLTSDLMRKIVDADPGATGAASSNSDPRRYRWTKNRKG